MRQSLNETAFYVSDISMVVMMVMVVVMSRAVG